MTSGTLSYDLAKFSRLIPGYDPYATAGDEYHFDHQQAAFALDFFTECLSFTQGEKAGRPFVPEPWEAAIIVNLWGWRTSDGRRRYREAFIFVPRRNGKTELAAGIVCLVLYTDGEPGAELYSAAAERDLQAAKVFNAVRTMIKQESELLARSQIYKHSIVVGNASYKVLSSSAHTKHGLNAHLVICDELHAQRNRELVDVLATSTGSREQPLLIWLSTSDFERAGSICNEKHDYASKVRDGVIDDPAFLPVIYEATKEADWKDPKVWRAANPNLGVSISEEYLARECRRAEEIPEYENTFRRLHLNIRTEQAFRWMPLDKWDACDGAIDRELLRGQPCHGALDLATISDMAALVLAFEVEEEFWLLPFFWCPEETAEIRERKYRQPYLTWARQELLELTPGNSIDYRFIRRRINELKDEFVIRELAFDPWNTTQLATDLGEEDGFEMIEFRQGTLSMNEPMKTLMRLVLSRQIRHGGHPILRWNATNIVARKDASDNLRPDKEKSVEKIDGLVAAIMAIGRANIGDQGTVDDPDTLLQFF